MSFMIQNADKKESRHVRRISFILLTLFLPSY